MVVLDLSITATGYATGDGDCGTIKTNPKHGDHRLGVITAEVEGWFDCDDGMTERIMPADLVVIEGPVVRSSAAVIIGMVHGAVRLRLMDWRIPYAVVPPATLKKFATGKGNADKTAMALALFKRTGLELADDNQVDAWWLRAAGLQHLGCPVVDLPAAQVAALEKVDWPVVAPFPVEGEK